MKDRKDDVDVTCISCSVFRREIEALKSKGIIQCRTRYLPMWKRDRRHDPGRAAERLVREEREANRKVLLLCGGCHAGAVHTEDDDGVYRVPVRDCFELLVGTDRYRCHEEQHITYLLPEWVDEWSLSVRNGPGDPDAPIRGVPTSRGAERIVYLNTGLIPIPGEQINHIAIRTGLPVEVMDVSLDRIFRAIMQGMRALHDGKTVRTPA